MVKSSHPQGWRCNCCGSMNRHLVDEPCQASAASTASPASRTKRASSAKPAASPADAEAASRAADALIAEEEQAAAGAQQAKQQQKAKKARQKQSKQVCFVTVCAQLDAGNQAMLCS